MIFFILWLFDVIFLCGFLKSFPDDTWVFYLLPFDLRPELTNHFDLGQQWNINRPGQKGLIRQNPFFKLLHLRTTNNKRFFFLSFRSVSTEELGFCWLGFICSAGMSLHEGCSVQSRPSATGCRGQLEVGETKGGRWQGRWGGSERNKWLSKIGREVKRYFSQKVSKLTKARWGGGGWRSTGENMMPRCCHSFTTDLQSTVCLRRTQPHRGFYISMQNIGP